MKTQEDYMKEIAEKINNAKRYYIENPTLEDIKNLKEFDYIITPTNYFDVKINKKYDIELFFGIPTVMWSDRYEIGDTCMGMIPEEFTAEDVYEEMRAFKGEIE